jgi:pimeloyl-ACP methyl ester carboxylesterase
MQRWFTPAFHAREAGQVARVRDTFLRTDVHGYLGCAQAIRDMDLRGELGQIRTPTLVLTGSFDTSTPTSLGQQIAAAIPGARWAELPAAHIPQIEQPAMYAELVENFLGAAD